MQSQSRDQGGEKISPVKQRKENNCEFSSSLMDNTVTSKANVAQQVIAKNNNFPCSSKNCVSRKDLLLHMVREKKSPESHKKSAKEINRYLSNLLQVEVHSSKPNATTSTIACKRSKEKDHIKSPSKAKNGKKVKFVRIFPGPAGLVPDRKSDDITVESCPNDEVESESKLTTVKYIETDLPKSQDDKNLFSEKAWNLLLIDLPCNFFKEYGISTIKNKADSNHCNSMKVKFIAGLLEFLDHGHDDPFIVLKDSTGSIEGTIHRNILLKFPGVLDPNVVIFVQDVGLLRTRSYVVTNKYHIFISQKNLLAVYSNKDRIMSAPQLESVLSKIVINENCDSTPFQTEFSDASTAVNNSHRVNKNQADKTDSGKTEGIANAELKQLSISASMDDLDVNDFFSADCEFEAAEERNRSTESSEVNSQTGEIQQRDSLRTQNTSRVESSRRGEATTNSPNKQTSSRTFQTRVANAKQTVDIARPGGHGAEFSSSSDGATREARKDSTSSVKPAKALVSYFTAGDNEYDSDDEMLSQLDVDNV